MNTLISYYAFKAFNKYYKNKIKSGVLELQFKKSHQYNYRPLVSMGKKDNKKMTRKETPSLPFMLYLGGSEGRGGKGK